MGILDTLRGRFREYQRRRAEERKLYLEEKQKWRKKYIKQKARLDAKHEVLGSGKKKSSSSGFDFGGFVNALFSSPERGRKKGRRRKGRKRKKKKR